MSVEVRVGVRGQLLSGAYRLAGGDCAGWWVRVQPSGGTHDPHLVFYSRDGSFAGRDGFDDWFASLADVEAHFEYYALVVRWA
ncbi:MAG: hypothetical protein MUC99_04390 [Anaerolineae bacterium]|jgi:hypothetical protein|nr:hypothetical protein [Anaerolineae bacterium]